MAADTPPPRTVSAYPAPAPRPGAGRGRAAEYVAWGTLAVLLPVFLFFVASVWPGSGGGVGLELFAIIVAAGVLICAPLANAALVWVGAMARDCFGPPPRRSASHVAFIAVAAGAGAASTIVTLILTWWNSWPVAALTALAAVSPLVFGWLLPRLPERGTQIPPPPPRP